MRSAFFRGMSHGIPIGLGYLSVSFGFGIMASRLGISALAAGIISLTNLTSAGQAAGIEIIAAAGGIIEMVLVQLTINLRYSLMALSLSQKLAPGFSTKHRLCASFGITDEIFAVCASQKEPLTPWYMYGMILVASIGWVTGTVLGASVGSIVPAGISAALGILLYGMFIAIIIPPAKKERSVLAVILTAAAMSVIIKFCFPGVSSGFSIIICGIGASALGALLFPVKDEEENS